MDQPEPTTSPSNTQLNDDVNCLGCDYNLRGLPGDPVRCPECFREESRAEVVARMLARVPQDPLGRIRRDLRGRTNLCGVAVIPGLLGAAGLVLGEASTRDLLRPLTATSVIVFGIALVLLAIRFWGVRGWWEAMAWHVLWASLAMAANLTVGVIAFVFVVGCGGVVAAELAVAFAVLSLLLIPPLIVVTAPMHWLTKPARVSFERIVQLLADRARQGEHCPPNAAWRSPNDTKADPGH